MKSKFSRLFIGLLVIVSMLSIKAEALQDASDYLFNGIHVYDVGGVLDVKGTLKIGGTTVTATAAQLNAAASGTVTNGVLNPSIVSNNVLVVNASNIVAQSSTVTAMSATSVIANLVSNNVLKVSASNLVVTTSVTLPAGSVTHANIAAGGAGGCIITNLSTLSTNILWFDAAGCLTNKTTSP